MMQNTIVLVGLGLLAVGVPASGVVRPGEGGANIPSGPVRHQNLKTLPIEQSADQPGAKSGSKSQPGSKKMKFLLGIQPGVVSPALKAQLQLDGFTGVLVEDIVKGSPAQKAGINKYDVIVKVGDKSISAPINIHEGIADANPGDKIPVELVRAGSRMSVSLELDPALCVPQEMRLGDNRQPDKNHIDEAIGAGRMSVPNDMFDTDEIGQLYQMMSQLMSRANSMDSIVDAHHRIERMRQMTNQLHKQLHAGKGVVGPSVQGVHGSSTFMHQDSKGVVEIQSDFDSGTRLTVKDAQGKVIFQGPYSSDGDKAKLPEYIKQRMQDICTNMLNR